MRLSLSDYVQALQDESKIRAEKIGSGNWYWSFVADDKIARQKALDTARAAYDKAVATDNELKAKLTEAQAQREQDDEALGNGGESREAILGAKKRLETEVEAMRAEVATYADTDPTALEARVKDAEGWKVEADAFTDDIYSMEGWVREALGGAGEGFDALLQSIYDTQYDVEARGLVELA